MHRMRAMYSVVSATDAEGDRTVIKANQAGRAAIKAVYPEALEHVIRRGHEEMPEIPILVTENGIATGDDAQRVAFIDKALEGVQSCIRDGIPVMGYCHWSLIDYFEWQKGYALTFGLCAVDRKTQIRTPKPSLKHLGDYLRK